MPTKTIVVGGLVVAGIAASVGIGGLVPGQRPTTPPAAAETTLSPTTRAIPSTTDASQRSALLVGISRYQNADGNHLKNLAGPVNDVKFMADVLQKWGFGSITPLVNEDAKRHQILKALDTLIENAKPGSHVLFYYSGHGTSKQDSNFGGGLPLLETTGALLVYDSIVTSSGPQAIYESLIVGNRDLRPRFEKLAKKNVYLTIWLDTCFSENSSYTAAPSENRGRFVPLPESPDPGEFGSGTVAYQPYPYPTGISFSASEATKPAKDIDQELIAEKPTWSTKFNGAFTDALLRALNNRAMPDYGPLDKNADGSITVDEFAKGVESFMSVQKYGHTPKLLPIREEDRNGTRQDALFYVENQSQQPQPQPQLQPPIIAKPEPPKPLRIVFSGTADQSRQLAQASSLEIVASGGDFTVSGQGAGHQISDANDVWVGHVDNFAALYEALRRRATLNRLLNTARQQGRAAVGLELGSAYASSRLPLGNTQHSIEAPITLQANQAGYPVVLDLFGDGTVQLLYPSIRNQEYNKRLDAGKTQTLMCVRTEPPTGVDTVYVFMLNEPLPRDILETRRIAVTNSNGFNTLLNRLDDPGRLLGADQLVLEVYEAKPEELQAWPRGNCP